MEGRKGEKKEGWKRGKKGGRKDMRKGGKEKSWQKGRKIGKCNKFTFRR